MKKNHKRACVGLLAALLTGGVPAETDPEPTQGTPVPVIVELFTSQGCSSCPPADRLLSRLTEVAGPGVEPLTLSFHVDYWDRLGWRDPFSSPEWSARQSRYAQAFGSNRVYTPQIVIDGRLETVGSDESEVRRLLAEAVAAKARGQVEVSARLGAKELRVDASARLPAGLAQGPCELIIAVVESGLTTQVERGENEDRRLANDTVVRRLERAGKVASDGATMRVEGLELPLGKGWQRDGLAVVAWVQDPRSMAILGGARAMPTAR